MTPRPLELLAPAKNLECGIAAIDHGADAVYIGASHHGARVAAGNSVADIKALCQYAHQFGVKVHVTVNTLVYDDELDETLQLVRQLEDIGVDALLIQDMGLLARISQARSSLSLHASTQCDTRTAEKVKWLSSLGFSRVVLARELSTKEIEDIHVAVPNVELEVFVHGALCVSYSGGCYASEYCFGRSANRGECAQFCRLGFDLLDASGHVLERNRHFLSLKDLCLIDHLEDLAEAGACAFKIEGRLKDVGYVKNVVAAYSQRLDDIIVRHPDRYCRASWGRVNYHFTPDLRKTFNRGYTTYFSKGRRSDIASFDTPKAMGEPVGRVKELRHDSLTVAGTACFANGDGLCFFNGAHELEGFRVNRAVGNRLFPYRMPKTLCPGTLLYRNNDVLFEKILSGHTAERKIPVTMHYGLTDDGFFLCTTFPGGQGEAKVSFAHQRARQPQTDNIRRQLSRLGNTPYVCTELIIDDAAGGYFVPSSLLTELRRKSLDVATGSTVPTSSSVEEKASACSIMPPLNLVWQPGYARFPYLYNISNHAAQTFYAAYFSGSGPSGENKTLLPGLEKGSLLMQCRHCLRYSLGFCVRRGGRKPVWQEPLRLRLGDGRCFRVEFKCDECQMNVYAD